MDARGWHLQSVTVESVLNSAQRLAEAGQIDGAYALLTRFLNAAPDSIMALRMRAAISCRSEDWERALADYNSVISLQPDCADCYFERGNALMRTGDVHAAIDDFSTCLSIEPRHAPALASRAAMLLQVHCLEQALDDIASAAEARPLNDRDIHNRAVILVHMGRVKEAISEYQRALELNPDSGGTHNNLAWLLATSEDPRIRNGRRAVGHALRAVELGRTGGWMDTLAAAYAESGDFDAAVAAEDEALQLVGGNNPAFLKRKSLYQHGISYAAWLGARRRNEDV